MIMPHFREEIERLKRSSEKSDFHVEKLHVKKRTKPLSLGEKLHHEMKCYIQAVQEKGRVITTSSVMAAATAIVRSSNRNLLVENRGLISITTNWAKFLIFRLNFVERRGVQLQ